MFTGRVSRLTLTLRPVKLRCQASAKLSQQTCVALALSEQMSCRTLRVANATSCWELCVYPYSREHHCPHWRLLNRSSHKGLSKTCMTSEAYATLIASVAPNMCALVNSRPRSTFSRGSRYLAVNDLGLKHNIHYGLWDLTPISKNHNNHHNLSSHENNHNYVSITKIAKNHDDG